MKFDRKHLVEQLFKEALDRVQKGEYPDPAMAVVAALCQGTQVPDAELELILRAHTQGSWVVETPEELQVFARWCEACGSPLQIGEAVETEGLRVYRDDFGDCVLAEAARGAWFAVWTRKGRLHIGFKNEADATKFRAANSQFSLEATGNKRVAFVVVEGGDTPETIAAAGQILGNSA